MPPFPYQRIVVTGATSSGKSTLAEQLARRFDYRFIELDALHWEPNWTEAPPEVFRERVRTAIRSQAWVVAGNYRAARDLIWPQAEVIIWLDYPFWTVFWQLTRRTFKRWWTQELLWGTNYESLPKHLQIWSQDSLYNWLFKTYWRRKRETPSLLSLAEHKHLRLIHFTHPRETNAWLKTL